MTIKKAQRLNKLAIDQLEKLLGQLRGLHVEVSALSKKSPNDGVNEFLGDHPKAAIDDQVKSGHREKA
jgi:hypothetical protein